MNTTYFLNCAAGTLFHSSTQYTVPDAYYLGLSTTAPATDGTGVTEPSADAGYARIQLTSLGEPVDGITSNTAAINFDESIASWGTVTHYVIFDSAEAESGNLLIFGELSSARSVEPGTIMTIKAGALKLAANNPD